MMVSNDGVTLFFLQKSDDLFSHRPLESDDLMFSYRLDTTPILFTFQRCRRLSGVLCKSSPQNLI